MLGVGFVLRREFVYSVDAQRAVIETYENTIAYKKKLVSEMYEVRETHTVG